MTSKNVVNGTKKKEFYRSEANKLEKEKENKGL